MTFNPYRPHRYPDSVNRSRFPVNAPQPGMRTMSSNPLPSNTWTTPIIQNVVYQNGYNPMPTPQSAFIPQKPRVPAIQTGKLARSVELESSYFQPCFTPDESNHDQWSAGNVVISPGVMFTNSRLGVAQTPTVAKLGRSSGLGLNFMDQDQDLTPTAYSGTTTDSFEDLVKLDEFDLFDFKPVSPDRRSWSSLSMSSGEGISDPSDFSDSCMLPTLHSNSSSGLDLTFLADNSSLHPSHADTGRRSSRPPTHPHSAHTYRTSPYSLNRTRSSSTSTAPISMPRTNCCSPLEECHEDFQLRDQPHDGDYQTDSFDQAFVHDGMFDDFYLPSEQVMAPKPQYPCESLFASPPFPEYHQAPPVLPSSGFFQLAHENSNDDHGDHFHHDLSDEPDLFGPLSEKQLQPPVEDMNPEDPDLEPRSQELRFEGDLYTPKYVRGHGNKREGWCGICKPGRWLVLKNSAYWYDKSFTHGISAATGLPFEGPKESRRMSGNPDVWEGLCGSCGEWIALISSKKKGTTWFRHAYKVSNSKSWVFDLY